MSGNPHGPLVIRRTGDVCVVDFLDTSIIDSTKIERIKAELDSLTDRMGQPKIVVSFDGVTHLASAMLGVLMAINKKAVAQKGQLRLTHLNPMILEIIRITKLDKVLKVFETTDKALERF